jgi:hypothetical protein
MDSMTFAQMAAEARKKKALAGGVKLPSPPKVLFLLFSIFVLARLFVHRTWPIHLLICRIARTRSCLKSCSRYQVTLRNRLVLLQLILSSVRRRSRHPGTPVGKRLGYPRIKGRRSLILRSPSMKLLEETQGWYTALMCLSQSCLKRSYGCVGGGPWVSWCPIRTLSN